MGCGMPCKLLLILLQECVRRSLKAKQLDYLLDDTKAAPGGAAAAGPKT
jgi:hypothetical protein